MDERVVERDWRSRGFSCGVMADPPGQLWQDFVHDVDELLMLVEGELQLEMQGRVTLVVTGEEYHIPAGVSHSVKNVGQSDNRWLYGYEVG